MQHLLLLRGLHVLDQADHVVPREVRRAGHREAEGGGAVVVGGGGVLGRGACAGSGGHPAGLADAALLRRCFFLLGWKEGERERLREGEIEGG